MAWVGTHGLFGPATQVLGICHDNPDVTPPDQLRYNCAVTVGQSFQPEGDVGVQTIAAGDFAIATFRRPYEELPHVYRHLYATWLPTSGRKLGNGPPLEVYHNAPGMVQREDLLTDVCIPLA